MGKKNLQSNIIQNYLETGIDNGDSSIINNWLESSKSNRHIFSTHRKLSIEQEAGKRKYKNLTEKAYGKFSARLNESESSQSVERKIKNIQFRKNLLRYAAGAAIFVLVGAGSFFGAYSLYHVDDTAEFVIEVPYGGQSNITLPDGSSVWLNAGSKLIYSRQFSATSRNVRLEGEAFFDVQKSTYPFIVHTSHLDIHVLGTSFNVKSYPDEDKIETTLVEGEIRIERLELANPLLLKPNEKMTFYKVLGESEISSDQASQKPLPAKEDMTPKKRLEISKIEIFEGVNTRESTSWKEGDLIFNKVPLSSLARMLERKYDIQFVFESEDLKDYSYSGTLRDFPLEQVLKALELTSPVRYKIDGKKVTLSMNSNFK